MSIRSFIGANTGVQDVFFLGTKLSPFAYKGWTVSTNFMLERKEYDPLTAPAFGQSVKFQYPNDCDLAGPVTLVIKLPRLDLTSSTNHTDADPGYIAGVGWHCINRIEIKYGANLLQTIKPEEMEIRSELFEPDEILKYTRENVLEGFPANDMHDISKVPDTVPSTGSWWTHITGTGAALDATSFTTAHKNAFTRYAKLRTCIVNLTTLFWGQTPNQWLPIFLLRDPNNLIIEVFFKNLNQIVTRHTPATAASGFSAAAVDSTSKFEVKLRCTNVHLSQAEKAYFSARAGARGNKGGSTEDDGLLYKFQDYERHEREVISFSGSAEKKHTLRLSNFRSPTTQLIFFLREKRKVDGVYNNTASSETLPVCDKDSYKYIEFNKVTANGNDLLREYDDKQTTVSEMLLYFPNGFKKNIYVRVINDLTPTDEINCVGSINFMNLNNPQLELRWSRSDLVEATDHYLDVFAKTHQIIQLVNGQLHRLFN